MFPDSDIIYGPFVTDLRLTDFDSEIMLWSDLNLKAYLKEISKQAYSAIPFWICGQIEQDLLEGARNL